VIKRGADLVPVRLGKPLDKRLAGREAVVVTPKPVAPVPGVQRGGSEHGLRRETKKSVR